ncbi:lysine--tRNA ligase [Methanofervidicoccus sp. A16]|uniref:lysine--tRNA ligase n=1 Tax=Methanofervidicoccus sp. A16 TaxID=2607662 RepID=UPI0011898905|nr:lysine--tRNA ligase [Methanofervidicoccus sp. A16]AXI24700.1 lysine--tRNA ligase [Methanofervidicoccus sp. A16]
MHWADVTAKKVIKKRKDLERYVVACGITPSGHIHIGNAREVITADALYKGLLNQGVEGELIFIGDTYDPLRKVYPFLPESYERYVGMPLSEIPCPEGCCESYAQHFLKPFLESLDDLGIEMTVYCADRCYKEGIYDDAIVLALENRDKIREVLNRYRSDPLPEDWYPLSVVCENCGKLSTTKVIDYNQEEKTVEYLCTCGHRSAVEPFRGRAKLPWRVDWPARWSIFKVTVEPMGKDHGTSGGSYDTGVKIARIVYNYQPPEKVIYEWIQLKIGEKAVPMSSSSGVVFAVKDWLSICHPEVLRYLILRSKPSKHIDFDLKSIPNLTDDYDQLERNYFELIKRLEDGEELKEDEMDKIRIYQLSTPKIPEKLPLQVPYRFCAVISQIAYREDREEIDMERVLDILRRNNYPVDDMDEYDFERLKSRLYMARNWALKYGEVLDIIPLEEAIKEYNKLSEKQKEWISVFRDRLKDIEFQGLLIHELIYSTAKEIGLNPREAFLASYRILLGKNYGPKLGSFLSSLDREFVIRRYSLLE